MDLSINIMDSSMIVKRSDFGYEGALGRRRDPDEFFECFSSVKKRISMLAAQGYAAAELGTMQAKLLRHIGKHSKISQADLARATDSDPTLTSRTLQTLIERGLVRRERSDEDRREYVLELTAAGRRVREHVEQLRAAIIARVVDALDERDFADFERIAGKILAATEPK
jgi:DNA-binding MarR family transcriptional regulator